MRWLLNLKCYQTFHPNPQKDNMEGKRDSLSHTTPFLVGWVERKNGILRLMSSRTGNIIVCSHDSHVTCCCNSKNYVWQYKIRLKKASSWSAKFRQFNVAGKFINTLYFTSLNTQILCCCFFLSGLCTDGDLSNNICGCDLLCISAASYLGIQYSMVYFSSCNSSLASH